MGGSNDRLDLHTNQKCTAQCMHKHTENRKELNTDRYSTTYYAHVRVHVDLKIGYLVGSTS